MKNPIFNELIPSHIRVIDPAKSLARNLDKFLGYSLDSCSDLPRSPVDIQFCVTSDPVNFSSSTNHWLVITEDGKEVGCHYSTRSKLPSKPFITCHGIIKRVTKEIKKYNLYYL